MRLSIRTVIAVALVAALVPTAPRAAAQDVLIACAPPGSDPVVALTWQDSGGVVVADLAGADAVRFDEDTATRQLSWGPTGDLAYELIGPSEEGATATIVVRSVAGALERPLRGHPLPAGWLDGSGILLVHEDGMIDRLDARSGHQMSVTALPDDGQITGARLSPAGDQIAFTRRPTGLSPALWVTDLEGAQRPLTERLNSLQVLAWLPDGSGVIVGSEGLLLLVGLDGTRRTLLAPLQRNDHIADAEVSPGGTQVLVAAARDADADGDDFVTLVEYWDALQLLTVPLAGSGDPQVLSDLGPHHAPVGVDIDDLGEHVLITADGQSSKPAVSNHWVMPLDDPAATPPISPLMQGIGTGAFAPTCADRLSRASGPTRIETAAAVSAATFDTAHTVIIARADRPLDALLSGPLGRGTAPILLTPPFGGLHPSTAFEIRRLGASAAVVVGHGDGVSDQAVTDLEGIGLAVDRLAGEDPYATAAAVADRLNPSRVLLIRGEADGSDACWPDAVSAAAWASRDAHAILPTPVDALHPETAEVRLAGGNDVLPQIVGLQALQALAAASPR